MRCPWCGGGMTAGVIRSGQTVFFTTEPGFLDIPDTGDVTLTRHNWTGPTAEAYLCPRCRKVVIDCGAPEEEEQKEGGSFHENA